jgi:hypothetical protein
LSPNRIEFKNWRKFAAVVFLLLRKTYFLHKLYNIFKAINSEIFFDLFSSNILLLGGKREGKEKYSKVFKENF